MYLFDILRLIFCYLDELNLCKFWEGLRFGINKCNVKKFGMYKKYFKKLKL